jgi:3',5'-cyclic AMP phosphodiesterase CpdA
MTTVLQISDSHFGTERGQVVQALRRLADQQVPDLVVLSGDITQRARHSQFEAACRFIDLLKPAAVLAIPGNHDIPLFNLAARVFAPYANYARAFGQNLEPVFEREDVLVIGVNTTRPRRHKDGEVSSAQIDRVAERLRRATPAQLRIVVVHQPVLAIRASDEKESSERLSAGGARVGRGRGRYNHGRAYSSAVCALAPRYVSGITA